jgi:predicted metalloendopeptidase
LSGQQEQEPRWKRSAKVIDGSIGEALGQLYVEKYFPPEAKARMNELVENLKTVVRDRLQKLDWMTEATRAKALAKFARFTQKIGHRTSSATIRQWKSGVMIISATFAARALSKRIGKRFASASRWTRPNGT